MVYFRYTNTGSQLAIACSKPEKKDAQMTLRVMKNSCEGYFFSELSGPMGFRGGGIVAGTCLKKETVV